MGSRIVPSSRFPSGFNIMGYLGFLYVASQAVGLHVALGLLISGYRPKGHGTHNALLFLRLEDHALLIEEKYHVSGSQVWRIVDY